MKKIFRFLILTVLAGSTLFYTSCETLELEDTQSPDDATPDQSSIDLFMNSIQIDFGANMGRINRLGAELTRLEYMFGRDYLNNYTPTTMNGIWTEAYQGMFQDIKVMKPQATEAQLYEHVAIAEILQAYMLVSLVDYLGDIPFTEANDSNQFPLPSADSGASVYQAALDLLTSADNNFSLTPLSSIGLDFYYGGDIIKWRKLINTLRMKIYLQTRLVDANAMTNFNAIVTSGNYITSADEDFEFPWGDSQQNPDTRHPDYAGDYTNSGAGDYQSNWLMYTMQGTEAADATFPGGAASSTLPVDPRIRFYFFRQNEFTPGVAGAPADLENLQCSLQTAPAHYTGEFANQFCGLANGYWGRTHGSAEGGPPDGFLKTAFGVYPAGGLVDGDNFRTQKQVVNDNGTPNDPSDDFLEWVLDEDDDFVGLERGAKGAGIHPIMLASYVDFMLAEADMIAGGAGEAAALAHVQDGLNKSIAKVQAFGDRDGEFNGGATITPDDPLTPGDETVTVDDLMPGPVQNNAFVTAVGSAWNTTTSDGKWELLAEQYFITQFGAGMDAYNFYRRNGYPTSLTPSIEPNMGNFVRSFFYPVNETSSNPNITQKANLDTQVFWDTNPASPGFPAAN
jgi:hypothetical protein